MTVAIVGAGPGDPKLVTVRALELVRDAQILVFDRLVSEELVDEARHAIRIARDELSQERVNEVLVRHGRRGRRVVRLKGGDPFVFGRGYEEVQALEAAGVPYELVPGVSTLTALPALAGIPLTTRGVADRVTVITGTRADGAPTDYEALAATPGTIVVFMGLQRLPELAAGLIAAGRPAAQPAAVASRLSLPDYELRVGTLGTIAARAEGLATPALVVIGDVAGLSARDESVWSAAGD
jgi:uroporphyrin-III C-methyltransferase